MERWVSDFALVAITPIGRVKNIVDYLEGQTNAIAKCRDMLDLVVRCLCKIGADPYGDADQRTRL